MKQWVAVWRNVHGHKYYWCHDLQGSGYWVDRFERPTEALARYVTREILIVEMSKLGMAKGLDYEIDKEPS